GACRRHGMGASTSLGGVSTSWDGCIDVVGGRVDLTGWVHRHPWEGAPPKGVGACPNDVGATIPKEGCTHTTGRVHPYRRGVHRSNGRDAPIQWEGCTHETGGMRPSSG